eukprot:1418909-Prymnesium_polylepis.1
MPQPTAGPLASRPLPPQRLLTPFMFGGGAEQSGARSRPKPGAPRDWQAGIDLLEGVCDPSKRQYDSAITTCGRAGQWELALGLLRRMS